MMLFVCCCLGCFGVGFFLNYYFTKDFMMQIETITSKHNMRVVHY